MAQWWELAIPAAGTLLGAAVGAGSQLVLRGRQERHERAMRFVDEKVRVYSRIITLIAELPRARAVAQKSRKAMEPYADGFDLDSVPDPAEKARIFRLAEQAAVDTEEAANLLAEFVALVNSLRIWGPSEVASLALDLNEAYRDGRMVDVDELRPQLVQAIRKDLRVDGSKTDLLARLRYSAPRL